MGQVFALDISESGLRAGFVLKDFEVTAVSHIDIANFVAGETSPLEKLLALLMAKMRTAPEAIDLIAVMVDCDVTPDRRGVLNFPGASWLADGPVADFLEKNLGKPVVLDHRAKALLAYDMALLGIPTDVITIGCYINAFYESAIWCRGAFLNGKSGAAGNIGHMPVHGREDVCRCGKSGCIELYGAGVRLKQMHSLIFPDFPLQELFVENANHPIIHDFLTMMAYPIAVEADILDPDFIVLGGDIPMMNSFPIEIVEQAIRDQAHHPYPAESLTLIRSTIKAPADRLIAAARHASTLSGK